MQLGSCHDNIDLEVESLFFCAARIASALSLLPYESLALRYGELCYKHDDYPVYYGSCDSME